MDHRVRSGRSDYTCTQHHQVSVPQSPSACPPPCAQGTASTLTAFSQRATATITSAPLSKDDKALFGGIQLDQHVDLFTIDDYLLLSSSTDGASDEETVYFASPELAPVGGRRPALLGPMPPALLTLAPGDGSLDILDVIGVAHAWEDELAACQQQDRQTSCGTSTSFLDFNLDIGLDGIGDVVDADFWSL